MLKKTLLTLLLLVYSHSTFGGIYKYTQLQTKDLEQMRRHMNVEVRKAAKALQNKDLEEDEAVQESVDILRDLMKYILSRPDRDNMISKLLPTVRTKLRNLSAYEDSLAFLTTQAIHSVKNKKINVEYRATSLFILQNIMSEMKPYLGEKKEAERIFKKIHKAKIKISSEIISHVNKYGTYKRTDSPSDIAKVVLKNAGLLKD